MQIQNDLLKGVNINHENSPNCSGLVYGGRPDTIVIHYTAGSSAQSSIRTLCNPAAKASAHLVVGPMAKRPSWCPLTQLPGMRVEAVTAAVVG
jgi:N-acetyl-anhydromuramyl-L-alanine amidase AmpD